MERRCQCHYALSFKDACGLLSTMEFDLVVSSHDLPNGAACYLTEHLSGSSTTMFFFKTLENDCLWIPKLVRGSKWVGQPVLRPDEFAGVLTTMLACLLPEAVT